MSEILTPNDFDVSILSWVEDGAMRQAGKRHDAALRAENARLRDLLTSARYYVGHAGEMRDAIDAALAPADAGKEER